MNDIVEEIKKRVDIVEFISQYVQLKKRGSNYFGLCPFHTEKTPSFSVNPQGNFFHCFGCGESGDVITFLMKIENLEFKDAVLELARRYDIPIKFSEKKEKNPLIEIHRIATEYFTEKLLANQKALEYLKKREIEKDAIERFSLGYAPQSSELEKLLLSKGFTAHEMVKSGIFAQGTRNLYNRFSERIIFPIRNESGHVVAFGGRVIGSSKDRAKYLNSPETPIFSKQKILYGFYSAKEKTRKTKSLILTEGYMDCIRLKLNGFENSTATLGTALSKFHIAAISRIAEKIYLNYDADEAGFRAMVRSAPTILSSKLKPYVIILDKGEDPDSFLLKHSGEKYREKIENAIDYFDYIVQFLKNRYNTEDPHEKLKAIEELKPILNSISDPIVKGGYIAKASKIFNVSENAFLVKGSSFDYLSSLTMEDAFLSIILKDIELLSWIDDFDEFSENFEGERKNIYLKLINIYLSGEKLDTETLKKELSDGEMKLVYKLLSLPQTDIEERYERRKVLLYLIAQFKIKRLKKKLLLLKDLMKKEPKEDYIKEYNETFSEIRKIVNDWPVG